MSEISKYESNLEKLQKLCDENGLTAKFSCRDYPIRLTVRPVSGIGGQMSMLGKDEDFISPDASLVFAMVGGDITYRMSEKFVITDELFSKLKTIFKNMHSAYTGYFFRDIVERGVLKNALFPALFEDAEEVENG